MEAKKKEFELLLMPCLRTLYGVARRYTRDEEAAQDLVGDTVTRAWEQFEKLKERQKFRAWIIRIETNIFFQTYRKKRKQPIMVPLQPDTSAENFSLYEQLADPLPYWRQNPEKVFLQKVLEKDIREAVDTLPESYRVVFTLCDIEEISYQETADILDIKTGTVRSRLHRARSLLQKQLWRHAKEKGYIK